MANFDLCFEKTIALEGGYILHEVAGDKGGITFAGIARNYWPDWTGWQLIDGGETSGQRIKAMVADFYRSNFWVLIRGDQIRFNGVAFAIYDFAVNAGVKTSVKIAQKIVGAVADGIPGPKTISALNGYVRDEISERLFITEFSLSKVYMYKISAWRIIVGKKMLYKAI